jgi:DNA-directed RNA polymerase subunit RPC12/RpoP
VVVAAAREPPQLERMLDTEPTHPHRSPDPARAEACIGCGADVADPVEGGLHCATCGQWQYLCGECMPRVPEHAADAAWLCPECRDDARWGLH